MSSYLRGIRNKLNIPLTIKSSENLQIKFPERLKGTIFERWSNYWKQLFSDYKEVAINVGNEAKNKPIKTGFYILLSGTMYLCNKNNPNLISYIDKLRLYNHDMLLVNEKCHKIDASKHLRYLEQCFNAGLIRRLSLGFISFIWLANYDDNVALYKAQCPYLQPEYTKFHERIIDIGFWNKWWKLDEIMVDYDINF